jgi:hypothetical protein
MKNEDLLEILKTGRKYTSNTSNLSTSEVYMKLMEELGEFSTATLIASGKMPHKQLDGEYQPIEECVDVIILVLDIINTLYPELTSEEIHQKINEFIPIKISKWVSMVDGN